MEQDLARLAEFMCVTEDLKGDGDMQDKPSITRSGLSAFIQAKSEEIVWIVGVVGVMLMIATFYVLATF